MPEFEKCKVCGKEFLKYDQRGFRNAGFTAHQNKCVEKGPLPSRSSPDDNNKKRNQRLLLPASRSAELAYSPYSTKNRRKFTTSKSKPTTPTSVQSPVDYTHHHYNNESSTFHITDQATSGSSGLLENNIFPVTQCDYCTPNFGSHQPNCWFLTNMINESRH